MIRRFKIVGADGKTFNCATHTLDEAARELLEARERGELLEIRRGSGHALSPAEAKQIVRRATEMAL